MGRIKAGSSTGLYDANGEEIFEGQYVYTEDGKKWRVNAYKQAIPYGEGAAVKLSDLLKQGVTIMEPVSAETAADAFKGMGEAIGELGSAIDSLFPDTEKDGRGNVVVTEPEAGTDYSPEARIAKLEKEKADLLKKVAELQKVVAETGEDYGRLEREWKRCKAQVADLLMQLAEEDSELHTVRTELEALKEAEPLNPMQEASSQELADELRRRGWTVKATKLVEI